MASDLYIVGRIRNEQGFRYVYIAGRVGYQE